MIDDSEETLDESSFSSSYGIESDTEDTYEEEEDDLPRGERSNSSLRRSCRNKRNLPSDYGTNVFWYQHRALLNSVFYKFSGK